MASLKQIYAYAVVTLLALAVVVDAFAQIGSAKKGATPLGLEPLGPQALAAGQCGLFLWSRSAERRERELIAIIGGQPPSVYVRVSGRLTSIPRTAVDGTGARPAGGYQVYPVQRFAGDTMSASVRLTLAPPPTRVEFPIVRGGVVAFRSPGGWETVTPVSGEVRCTPS